MLKFLNSATQNPLFLKAALKASIYYLAQITPKHSAKARGTSQFHPYFPASVLFSQVLLYRQKGSDLKVKLQGT